MPGASAPGQRGAGQGTSPQSGGSNSKKGRGPNGGAGAGAPAKKAAKKQSQYARVEPYEQPMFDIRMRTLSRPFDIVNQQTNSSSLSRGFMVWDRAIPMPPGYLSPASLKFLFNPSSISTSYQIASGQVTAPINYPTSSTMPSQLKIPLNQSTQFALYFDRTYELNDPQQSDDIMRYGVDVDIFALQQYTGMFAGVYSGNNNNQGTGLGSGTAKYGKQGVQQTVRTTPGGIPQGIMQMTLGYCFFGGETMTSTQKDFQLKGISYYGYIDSWGVQYCLDETTEILTRRGWLTHDELTNDDQCLGIDPVTQEIKWQEVESIHRFEHDGTLVHWQNSHGFDALGTANHRWLMESGQFERTYQISGTRKNIRTSGGTPQCFASHPLHTDEFVELIGWTVTEGTYPQDSNLGVRLGQSNTVNPLKTERIRTLAKYFHDHGATTSEYDDKTHQLFYFGKGIGNLIRQTAPDKQLTPEFLCSLTEQQGHLLYETLIDGDGHRGSTYRWAQKDQGRINGFQMLTSMLGRRSCAKKHKGTSVSDISVYVREVTSAENLRETEEYYKGIVWCPKTPTGTWLARRNGGTYFTGNTHFTQKMVPMRAVVNVDFQFLPAETDKKQMVSYTADIGIFKYQAGIGGSNPGNPGTGNTPGVAPVPVTKGHKGGR